MEKIWTQQQHLMPLVYRRRNQNWWSEREGSHSLRALNTSLLLPWQPASSFPTIYSLFSFVSWSKLGRWQETGRGWIRTWWRRRRALDLRLSTAARVAALAVWRAGSATSGLTKRHWASLWCWAPSSSSSTSSSSRPYTDVSSSADANAARTTKTKKRTTFRYL